jgi:hypothetical protein
MTGAMEARAGARRQLFDTGFRAALCQTYADLLRRQRTAATPFAQWSDDNRRAHDFVWLGGAFDREQVSDSELELALIPFRLDSSEPRSISDSRRVTSEERPIVKVHRRGQSGLEIGLELAEAFPYPLSD